MSEARQLSDFPNVSVEDTISLTLGRAANPGEVEFILETASNVTWWKALELRSRAGQMVSQVETQDANHGPRRFTVPADALVGARLTLAKAKLFGIHTGMYELQNLSPYRGRSFHFLWQRDEHRDGPVAGFFRDLGQGISNAANAVAGVVVAVVNAVAEFVGALIETVGNALAGLLIAVGEFLGGLPLVGPLIRAVSRWLGSIVSAVFDFVATVVRGVLNLAANVIAGVLRMVGGAVGGLLAWDGRLLVRGVGDFVSGIVGAVVGILGKLLALIQAVFFLQMRERPLNAAERAVLTRVYRKSVDLNNVRIIEGFAGFFSLNDRPFTLGNKIYMKNVDPAADPALLVHECGHVWQHQHEGTRYISDALWAQATLPDAYSWQAEVAGGRFRWQDFNKEAQAAFLEDVFRAGRRVPPAGTLGEFYDDAPIGPNVEFRPGGSDNTGLARESVEYVRSF